MFVNHLVNLFTSANKNHVVVVQLSVLQKVVEILGTHPLSTVNVKAVLCIARGRTNARHQLDLACSWLP
jgi:hypothetical protein